MRYVLILAALLMTGCQFGMRADTPPFLGGDGGVGSIVLNDDDGRCDPCIVKSLRCHPAALREYLASCRDDGTTIPLNLRTRFREDDDDIVDFNVRTRFREDRENDATLQVGVEAATQETMRRAIVEELARMRAAEEAAAETASDPARFPPSR